MVEILIGGVKLEMFEHLLAEWRWGVGAARGLRDGESRKIKHDG
jgi:hypothetical protein